MDLIEEVVSAFLIAIIGSVVFLFRDELRKRLDSRKTRQTDRNTVSHYDKNKPSNYHLKTISIIVLGIIVSGIVIGSSVKIVNAGNRGVLTHFNAVDESNAIQEGIHFVVPFRDDIIPVETRTLKSIENASSASADLQDVQTTVAVNYHVDLNKVQIVYEQIGTDYDNRVISPAVQESVKQITAKFTAEELITRRGEVKSEIDKQITDRLTQYNIVVEATSITDFKFSDQFTQAIESKVTAQQDALKAENILSRIEIEANQTVAKAQGDAKSNVVKAQGEAQAVYIISEALQKNPQYLEWLKTQRWNGQLPQVVGSGATPFIQIPTGNNTS